MPAREAWARCGLGPDFRLPDPLPPRNPHGRQGGKARARGLRKASAWVWSGLKCSF